MLCLKKYKLFRSIFSWMSLPEQARNKPKKRGKLEFLKNWQLIIGMLLRWAPETLSKKCVKRMKCAVWSHFGMSQKELLWMIDARRLCIVLGYWRTELWVKICLEAAKWLIPRQQGLKAYENEDENEKCLKACFALFLLIECINFQNLLLFWLTSAGHIICLIDILDIGFTLLEYQSRSKSLSSFSPPLLVLLLPYMKLFPYTSSLENKVSLSKIK